MSAKGSKMMARDHWPVSALDRDECQGQKMMARDHWPMSALGSIRQR